MGLAQAPAAQTLESEARRALGLAQGPGITHADARGILRSRDAVVRGIDRDDRLAATRDALGTDLDRRHAAAARGRLRADNARLEEANRHLEKEIEAERERQRLRWIRWAVEIPVYIGVTAATGSPVIGSAVAGGVGTAVTGGDLDDVAIATFTRAATAGAHHVVGLGIDKVATAVGDSVASEVADRLAVYRLHPAVVEKATQEVAVKVARAVDFGLSAIAVRVLPDEDPVSGGLNRFFTGLGVVFAGLDLLNPVPIDIALDRELYLDKTLRWIACGEQVCSPDLHTADMAFLSGVKRKHGIGVPRPRMTGVMSIGPFGRLLRNKHYYPVSKIRSQ